MPVTDSEVMKRAKEIFECPACGAALESTHLIHDAIKLLSENRMALVTCLDCGTTALIRFIGLHDETGALVSMERDAEYYFIYSMIFRHTYAEGPPSFTFAITSDVFDTAGTFTANWEIVSFRVPSRAYGYLSTRVMSGVKRRFADICHRHGLKESEGLRLLIENVISEKNEKKLLNPIFSSHRNVLRKKDDK